ncbi:MAG: hemerythrin domain-containing protein [Thermoanaerobaculia bacterium]|nr:hemerythrin domain-containing protein [Acidobacteriota bacterium]
MEQEKSGRGSERRAAGAKKSPRASAGRPKRSGLDEAKGLLSRVIPVSTGEEEDAELRSADAVEILKKDHEKVRRLFKTYEATEERSEERKQIVAQISMELDIHAQVEETIFYPAFREAAEKESMKIVRESFEEHRIVKTLLRELGPMRGQDPQFEAKVTVLKENVEHHVEEEEDDLFPRAQKLLGDERLAKLGAGMRDLKKQLLDRAGTT